MQLPEMTKSGLLLPQSKESVRRGEPKTENVNVVSVPLRSIVQMGTLRFTEGDLPSYTVGSGRDQNSSFLTLRFRNEEDHKSSFWPYPLFTDGESEAQRGK